MTAHLPGHRKQQFKKKERKKRGAKKTNGVSRF